MEKAGSKERKGQYFVACGDCKQTTSGLSKEKANRTTCPKCGSSNIITDRI